MLLFFILLVLFIMILISGLVYSKVKHTNPDNNIIVLVGLAGMCVFGMIFLMCLFG